MNVLKIEASALLRKPQRPVQQTTPLLKGLKGTKTETRIKTNLSRNTRERLRAMPVAV